MELYTAIDDAIDAAKKMQMRNNCGLQKNETSNENLENQEDKVGLSNHVDN